MSTFRKNDVLVVSLTTKPFRPVTNNFYNNHDFVVSELTKSDFDVFQFTKKSNKARVGIFRQILSENPLSMAQTSGNLIEYTIDPHNIFKNI